jgi:hypothetical protein
MIARVRSVTAVAQLADVDASLFRNSPVAHTGISRSLGTVLREQQNQKRWQYGGLFLFTDDYRRQIASRRGAASRLGFAVQLGTVRYLGRFLENPADIPASVIRWTAGELGRRGALGAPGRDPHGVRLPPVRRRRRRRRRGRARAVAARQGVGER